MEVVAEAENGIEALHKYNETKPDIILTDLCILLCKTSPGSCHSEQNRY